MQIKDAITEGRNSWKDQGGKLDFPDYILFYRFDFRPMHIFIEDKINPKFEKQSPNIKRKRNDPNYILRWSLACK